MYLKDWSESPRTLGEELFWTAVESGLAEHREVVWKGAQKEPFITLEKEGWKKRESVLRSEKGTITVHFWICEFWECIKFLKIKTT